MAYVSRLASGMNWSCSRLAWRWVLNERGRSICVEGFLVQLWRGGCPLRIVKEGWGNRLRWVDECVQRKDGGE